MGGRIMTFANLGDEVDPAVAVSANTISRIDTRNTPATFGVSEDEMALRTEHTLFSDAFALDTLTPRGLAFVLR